MSRARDPEQKAAKREKILQAAAHLFLTNGHVLPSAADVANEANVAKGTVYLYFKTKEDIFLALYGQKMQQLLSSFHLLDTQQPIVGQMIRLLQVFNNQEPSFMPLSSILQSVLESKHSFDTLYQFKAELSQTLADAGRTLDQSFQYPEGFSVRALLHSYGSMLGLWQILQWPADLSEVQQDPIFQALRLDFYQELEHLFSRIWTQ